MDKYEYRLKTEHIKRLAARKEYASAVKICDGIDWNKVKDVKMLTAVSDIYEAAGRYQEATDVLIQAYQYAPIGRRIVYRLTELAVDCGNYQDAEEYYEEFCSIAPGDMGKSILKYKLEKAKGAKTETLIQILEAYKEEDFDERWSYELAELYAKAGRKSDCVALCDDIILWFGLGKYVDKALYLKAKFAPLSDVQKQKLKNGQHFYEDDSNVTFVQLPDEEQEHFQAELAESVVSITEGGEQEKSPVSIQVEEEEVHTENQADTEYFSSRGAIMEEESSPRIPESESEAEAAPEEAASVQDKIPVDGNAPEGEAAKAGESTRPEMWKSEMEENAPSEEPIPETEEENVQPETEESASPEQPFGVTEEEDIRPETRKSEIEESASWEQAPVVTEENASSEEPIPETEEENLQPEMWRPETEESASPEQPFGVTEEENIRPETRKSEIEESASWEQAPVVTEEENASPEGPMDETEEAALSAIFGNAQEQTAASAEAEPAPLGEVTPSEEAAKEAEVSREEAETGFAGPVEPAESGEPEDELPEEDGADAIAASIEAVFRGEDTLTSEAAGAQALTEQASADPQEETAAQAQDASPEEGRPLKFTEPGSFTVEEQLRELNQIIADHRNLGDRAGEVKAEPSQTAVQDEETQAEPNVDSQEAVAADPADESRVWHFFVKSEDPEEGFRFAVNKLRALRSDGKNRPSTIARTKGSKLNGKSIIKTLDKLLGKAVIVEQAGGLGSSVLDEFSVILDKNDRSLIVVFIDTEAEIDRIIEENPRLAGVFTAQFHARKYTMEDLMEYAKGYADGKDCAIDESARLVVTTRLEQILKENPLGWQAHVEKMLDEAVEKGNKKSVGRALKGLFVIRYDDEGRLLLKEEDFNFIK